MQLSFKRILLSLFKYIWEIIVYELIISYVLIYLMSCRLCVLEYKL